MTPADTTETLFTQWLRDHRGILVKVSRSFTREPADQSDLLQEMMFQLWQSLPRFRGGAKPSTWIYRVCLNTASRWRRTEGRRERHLEPDADLTQLAVDTASPAESAGQHELLERLYTAIHAMPVFDRSLVLLALDGLAYREMAEITGLTENHVGVALTRARKRLTELMRGSTDELE
jgi:RNA polymerase sigma factor (sigma-70 family)